MIWGCFYHFGDFPCVDVSCLHIIMHNSNTDCAGFFSTPKKYTGNHAIKNGKNFYREALYKKKADSWYSGSSRLSGALPYRYDKCISVPVFSPDGVSAVTLCDEFYQAEHRAVSEKRQAERFRAMAGGGVCSGGRGNCEVRSIFRSGVDSE